MELLKKELSSLSTDLCRKLELPVIECDEEPDDLGIKDQNLFIEGLESLRYRLNIFVFSPMLCSPRMPKVHELIELGQMAQELVKLLKKIVPCIKKGVLYCTALNIESAGLLIEDMITIRYPVELCN